MNEGKKPLAQGEKLPPELEDILQEELARKVEESRRGPPPPPTGKPTTP